MSAVAAFRAAIPAPLLSLPAASCRSPSCRLLIRGGTPSPVFPALHLVLRRWRRLRRPHASPLLWRSSSKTFVSNSTRQRAFGSESEPWWWRWRPPSGSWTPVFFWSTTPSPTQVPSFRRQYLNNNNFLVCFNTYLLDSMARLWTDVLEKARAQAGVLKGLFGRLAEILRECPGQYYRWAYSLWRVGNIVLVVLLLQANSRYLFGIDSMETGGVRLRRQFHW